jgi:hypothetical protein
LLAFADSKKCRVTVLSGDVHVGAPGMIASTRSTAEEPSSQVINQLTSSGIVHPPPPGVVLFFLETVAGKKCNWIAISPAKCSNSPERIITISVPGIGSA